jgi:Uri superfamily endonuclease
VTGGYVLLARLPERQTVKAGRLPARSFSGGYYAYAGSALNGIPARVRRHLSPAKKIHWHIDYLLQKATVTDIITGETKDRVECAIARSIGARFESIPGFGSSDCGCSSHLFFSPEPEELKSVIISAFKENGLAPEKKPPGDYR